MVGILAMKRAAANSGARVRCFECRYSSQFLATKTVISGLVGALHYSEIDYYGIGLVRVVSLEHEARAGRRRAAHRRLPRHGRAAAVHGRGGR